MIKIFIASHKNYHFPPDKIYHPLMVGKLSPYKKDININGLNASFSELEALYWLWQNDNSQITGLNHYRRYFKGNNGGFLSENEIQNYLKNDDILLAKPRYYFPFTIAKHYEKAHYLADWLALKNEIIQQCPQYLPAFEQVANGYKLSLYNMMIAKRAVINDYCNFLFPLLLTLERKIAYQNYPDYQKRVFGFLAERLLNVYLIRHSQLKVKYLPVLQTEKEPIIKKAFLLLKRHFLQ
jgi:hypothetical protein